MHIIARRRPRHPCLAYGGLEDRLWLSSSSPSSHVQVRPQALVRGDGSAGPLGDGNASPVGVNAASPLGDSVASAVRGEGVLRRHGARCSCAHSDIHSLMPCGSLMQCAQTLLSLSERHRESKRAGGRMTTSHRMRLPHQQSPDRLKARIRGSDSTSSGLTDTSMRQQAMPAWQTTCAAPPSAPRQLVPPGPALQDQGASTYLSHE